MSAEANTKAEAVTSYQELEPNFAALEEEPSLNDTEWGHKTRSTNADHLREAEVGDELKINDRARALTVREIALSESEGPYGRKRLYLQGNGCDYLIEVDLFHNHARFQLLSTGRASDSRCLGEIEWVVPDEVLQE